MPLLDGQPAPRPRRRTPDPSTPHTTAAAALATSPEELGIFFGSACHIYSPAIIRCSILRARVLQTEATHHILRRTPPLPTALPAGPAFFHLNP